MEAMALIGDLGLAVVDEEEIARCKELFTFYDEDKDGKLTYAELLTCVRCCGRNPSVDEFKELVQVIDAKLVCARQRVRMIDATRVQIFAVLGERRVCSAGRGIGL